MSASGSPQDLIARWAIACDVDFVGRYVGALSRMNDTRASATISNCMASYMSLIAYETSQALPRIEGGMAPPITDGFASLIARSRHSLKFFDDTKRGLAGQLKYFDEGILAAHRDRFFGNTWLWLARRFETDLGLSFYGDRLVMTTHGANFANGVDPVDLLAKGNERMMLDVGVEYGQYFAKLGARLDQRNDDVIEVLDPKKFGPPRDVRADQFYSTAFNGPETIALNAVLATFQAALNFATVAFDPARPEDPALGRTGSKLRFLALYSVLRSLSILREDYLGSLNVRSRVFIAAILDDWGSELLLEPRMRPLRNTLVHYIPDGRLAPLEIDPADPYASLVDAARLDVDAADLDDVVTRGLALASGAMQLWGDPTRAGRP